MDGFKKYKVTAITADLFEIGSFDNLGIAELKAEDWVEENTAVCIYDAETGELVEILV